MGVSYLVASVTLLLPNDIDICVQNDFRSYGIFGTAENSNFLALFFQTLHLQILHIVKQTNS